VAQFLAVCFINSQYASELFNYIIVEGSVVSDSNEQLMKRVKQADDYFEKKYNLNGLRNWYSQKASGNKKQYQLLSLVIIIAGAAIAVMQIFAPAPPDTHVHWSTIVTALLGGTVVIMKGIERIWDFDQTWLNYRRASELMKKEQRVFVNGVGPYLHTIDEEAFILFIDRVENIISDEQKLYWANRDGQNQENVTPTEN